jgi:CPA1 family monovalent cation:H+ antiporter
VEGRAAVLHNALMPVGEAFLLLLIASLIGIVAQRFNLPYTVALVVFGLALGATPLERPIVLTPDLVLLVFLPGLLFEAAIHLHVELLRRTWRAVLGLAGPGVLITMGVVAVLVHYWIGLPWPSAILLGAMVSPTDPIAVLAIFGRIGVPNRLATVVEGESLFNDGVGLVIYATALGIAEGGGFHALPALRDFAVAVAGGIALGGAFGFVASRLVSHIDDHLVEITVSVSLAYGSYLVAELLGVSGVLATISAGLVFGAYGRAIGMSERTQQVLDDVWSYAAFALNSLVFLLLGITINLQRLGAEAGAIALAVLATVIGRALAIYGLGGLFTLFRQATMPMRWRHLIFWAGLRGALSLALALALPASIEQRDRLIDLVAGIILVTILAQGSTIEWLARRLLPEGRAPAKPG